MTHSSEELGHQAEEAEAEHTLVSDGEIGEPADRLGHDGGVDEGPMPGPTAHRPGSSLKDKVRGLFDKD